MVHKIFRSGNSLAISLPANFVKTLGLKPKDRVNLKADYLQKTIHLSFPDSSQMTLLPTNKQK